MAKIVGIRVVRTRTTYTRVRALNVTYHTPTGCDTGPLRGPVHKPFRGLCNVAYTTPQRGVVPPLRGGKGAGKPKADRATTKKKT